MDAMRESMWLWFGVILPVLGLLGVIASRARSTAPYERLAGILFFGCLISVAGMTAWAVAADNHWWFAGGTNMSLMAVGATLDVGGRRSASAI